MVRGYKPHFDNRKRLLMYSKLANVVAESGIWNGGRKESHAFLLSPSVYQITEEQQQELSMLGFALYDCMMGLSHIAVIAYDQTLNYSGAWLLARKVFSTGDRRCIKNFKV